jgi:hypothetical protein
MVIVVVFGVESLARRFHTLEREILGLKTTTNDP